MEGLAYNTRDLVVYHVNSGAEEEHEIYNVKMIIAVDPGVDPVFQGNRKTRVRNSNY